MNQLTLGTASRRHGLCHRQTQAIQNWTLNRDNNDHDLPVTGQLLENSILQMEFVQSHKFKLLMGVDF